MLKVPEILQNKIDKCIGAAGCWLAGSEMSRPPTLRSLFQRSPDISTDLQVPAGNSDWLAPMRPGCFFLNLILLLIQFQPLVVMLSILYSSAGGAHTPRHKNSPENSRFSKKESKEETGIERQSIGTNATSIIVSPKIQHG